MSLNFADLVVLGDDLSGIAAGSLLAKRGLSVMVSDRPTPNHAISLPGLENHLFKSVVGKMGIAESRLRALQRNKISFQVILPNHRIDVTPHNDHLFEEFQREFPTESDWLRDLFEDVEAIHEEEARPLLHMIPCLNWREKRRYLRQKRDYEWPRWTEKLQELPASLQAFFKAWILFLAGNPTSFADAIQPFSLLSAENRSTMTVKGGWRELKQLFLEKIEYFGGTILPEPPADYELETESSHIKGVLFDGFRFATRCRYLVGNESFPEVISHFPKGFRTRRYRRQMSRSPSAREYTLHFLTSSKILPEPMCQNVLFIRSIEEALRA